MAATRNEESKMAYFVTRLLSREVQKDKLRKETLKQLCLELTTTLKAREQAIGELEKACGGVVCKTVCLMKAMQKRDMDQAMALQIQVLESNLSAH